MYKSNKINQIVCFIAVVLFFYAHFVYGAQGEKAEDALFELGKRYYEQGNYEEAMHEFDKVIYLNPSHSQALKYIELIKNSKDIPGQEETVQKAEPVRNLEYIIGEEDVMDITVWKTIEVLKDRGTDTEYEITKGDVLEVSVWQWPDLAKDVIVRPDGKISFPLVGDIHAEGITLTELDDILTRKLSDYIKEPQVSIMIKSFGGIAFGGAVSSEERLLVTVPFIKIDDLSQEVVVRPDGKISLPLIGDIQASGLTLSQLKDSIRKKLNLYIKNLRISVSMKSFGGKKIIVLGEVTYPGVYKPPGEINVVEAIGLAGGYTEDAVLKSVMLVRGNLDNPQAIRLNINNAIKKGDLSQNIAVQANDIIYVPRNFLKNINYFLDNIVKPLVTAGEDVVPQIREIRRGTSP
jgi:protein involved in polysaccharide export with SLBB domain